MRLTRAAQRAQQNVDELVDATDQERAPLNEISHNTTPELAEPEESMPMKTPAKTSAKTPAKTPAKKSKKGGAKKGAKGKKGKAIEDEEHIGHVTEDERQAAASPASDAAVEDPAKGPADSE